MISALPIKIVFQKIYEIIDQQGVDAVVFMGDLTDYGQLEHYDATVSYIASSLQLGSGLKYAHIPTGIVPGNHDVCRKLAKKPGLSEKFRPLAESLARYGLPQLPIESPKVLRFGQGTANASMILLNSCWGCGAQEFIPADFRTELDSAIQQAIDAGQQSILSSYYDRQLDTPAFSDQTVRKCVEIGRAASGTDALIFVAHHNIFPQRLTRLAPYTELVNSGALRGALVDLDRPVLYFHGHIHEDPIEIITRPGGQPLISVSAPAAEDGFNEIEIKFDRAGEAIVAAVRRWRFDAGGVLHDAGVINVPLACRRGRLYDPLVSKTLARVLDRSVVYWRDLRSYLKKLDKLSNDDLLEEIIVSLAADGLILVENQRYDREHWLLRAGL